MAAESVLHDLGAISIMSSDSMGMGRIGEVTRRTWQLAHVMKQARGGEATRNDNERILRYVAKLTINPALAHGIAHDVGTLEPGKLADVVLWRPAFFGAKPQLVLKSGFGAWAPLGSGSGSTRIGEPLVYDAHVRRHRRRAGGARRRSSRAPPGRSGSASAGPAGSRSSATCRGRAEGGHGAQRCDVRASASIPRPARCWSTATPVELEPARELPLNWAYFLA